MRNFFLALVLVSLCHADGPKCVDYVIPEGALVCSCSALSGFICLDEGLDANEAALNFFSPNFQIENAESICAQFNGTLQVDWFRSDDLNCPSKPSCDPITCGSAIPTPPTTSPAVSNYCCSSVAEALANICNVSIDAHTFQNMSSTLPLMEIAKIFGPITSPIFNCSFEPDCSTLPKGFDDAEPEDLLDHKWTTPVVSVALAANIIVVLIFVFVKGTRRHPNHLMCFRACFDILLIFCIGNVVYYKDVVCVDGCGNTTPTGYVLTFFVEFSLIGAELCHLAMSRNMHTSSTNPFFDQDAENKSSLVRITAISVFFGALATIFAGNASDISGSSTSRTVCWISYRFAIQIGSYQQNLPKWFLFYLPLVIFLTISSWKVLVSVLRLRQGLGSSLKQRNSTIKKGLTYACLFALFWLVAIIIYVSIATKKTLSQEQLIVLIIICLGARGLISLLPWIFLNIKHIKAGVGRGREEPAVEKPFLNSALRAELLQYTTKGIFRSHTLNQEQSTQQTRVDVNRFVYFNPKQEGRGIELTRLAKSTDTADVDFVPMTSENVVVESEPTWLNNKPSLLSLYRTFFGSPIFFTDYKPHVFQSIRKTFQIDEAAYGKSITQHARERFSEGKSGAFLYFSADNRFIVKTTTSGEAMYLISILDKYQAYVQTNPDTLLIRFYGCHSLRIFDTEIYFVVMENLFAVAKQIHTRFDLKGSWIDRRSESLRRGVEMTCAKCSSKYKVGMGQICPISSGEHQPNRVLKDLDMNHSIVLRPFQARQLKLQAAKDVEFLRQLNIMDYSLLVGVYYRRFVVKGKRDLRSSTDTQMFESDSMALLPKLPPSSSLLPPSSLSHESHESVEMDNEETTELQTFPAGAGDDSRLVSVAGRGDGRGEERDTISSSSSFRESDTGLSSPVVEGPGTYYIGIIDILQEWNLEKKLERIVKRVFRCKPWDGISSVSPPEYADRFLSRVTEAVVVSYNEPRDTEIVLVSED